MWLDNYANVIKVLWNKKIIERKLNKKKIGVKMWYSIYYIKLTILYFFISKYILNLVYIDKL